MKTQVGIVGFRGYSGAELVHILSRHPHVEPVLMEHRTDAEHRAAPLRVPARKKVASSAEGAKSANLKLVFLATPPEVSMQLATELLRQDIRVVDLSGAFRLRTPETYTHWYKEPHEAPELLSQAVYGLPEFYRDRIPGAKLLSNPGCYPTAANLAIRPLVQAKIADLKAGIVCDAKSGVSGAGRKPNLRTSFCEVTENFSAYSVLNHRHVPEVLLNSGLNEDQFSFTAQLIPIDRGILETIYIRATGIESSRVFDTYMAAYADEPFVRLYEPGQYPDLRHVARTNFCDIGFYMDSKTGRLVVITAIDNLVKGAAGQAVQNMNLMLGFPETEGLL